VSVRRGGGAEGVMEKSERSQEVVWWSVTIKNFGEMCFAFRSSGVELVAR